MLSTYGSEMGNYSSEIAEPPASAGQSRDVASRGEGA